jgi:hypothetical protein
MPHITLKAWTAFDASALVQLWNLTILGTDPTGRTGPPKRMHRLIQKRSNYAKLFSLVNNGCDDINSIQLGLERQRFHSQDIAVYFP